MLLHERCACGVACHHRDSEFGMIKIPETIILAGQRLPFDVFHQDGSPLLLRGRLIANNEQAGLIRREGYFNKNDKASVFAAMNSLSLRLSHVLLDIREGKEIGIFSRRIGMLAKDLISLVDLDPDAAFANIHLDIHHGYFVVHSMMAAIVSSRLALVSGFDRDERLSIVCAAMTHDLGLLPFEAMINARDTLTDIEMARVRRHVEETVLLLKRLGVDDLRWLEAVRNHHEFLDGSGYQGVTAGDLSPASRIMSLADSYSAMLRPRPYRDRLLARKALENLYANETDRYDGYLLEALIWDFGFYPPGSMLRLVNREMAVAIRNSPGLLDSPLVAQLTDTMGNALSEPVFRDANRAEHMIVEPLDPALFARSGHLIEQCWGAA